MTALAWLIPCALLLGLIGLAAFLWSLNSGQFEDLEGAGWRALQDDEPEKDGNHVRHSGLVVLYGNDVPEGAGQSQQGQIDGGDTHDQQTCQYHAGQVGFQEREKSREGRHDKGDLRGGGYGEPENGRGGYKLEALLTATVLRRTRSGSC